MLNLIKKIYKQFNKSYTHISFIKIINIYSKIKGNNKLSTYTHI